MLRSFDECLCIPWDMPRPDDLDAEICDYAGNQCFHSKMNNNTYKEENCKCLPSCSATHYSFQLESQLPIDLDKECAVNARGHTYVKSKLKNSMPFFWQMQELLAGGKESTQEIIEMFSNKYYYDEKIVTKKCREIFKGDVAHVVIKMENQSFMKLKKSLKYNTTIKLGTIGGTIGLFTGFSFMALLEIAYWIIITIKRVWLKATKLSAKH